MRNLIAPLLKTPFNGEYMTCDSSVHHLITFSNKLKKNFYNEEIYLWLSDSVWGHLPEKWQAESNSNLQWVFSLWTLASNYGGHNFEWSPSFLNRIFWINSFISMVKIKPRIILIKRIQINSKDSISSIDEFALFKKKHLNENLKISYYSN